MNVIIRSVVLLLMSSSSYAEAPLGTKELLLDNERVEVVRLTYPAGAESGMHTHEYPFRTAYFVRGGKLALTPDDQTKSANVLTVADGEVLFLPASRHNVKNIGDTEVIIIETEIK